MNKDIIHEIEQLPQRPAANEAKLYAGTDNTIIIVTPDGWSIVLTRQLADELAKQISNIPPLPAINGGQYLN